MDNIAQSDLTPHQAPEQPTEKPKRIIRAVHGKENPFFLVARSTAQDISLSFEARGLLVYVLSKPDHWQVQIADLKKHGMGRDKAYRALNELRNAGYIEAIQERQDGKFSTNTWLIHETPFTEKPYTVEPDTAKLQLDNTESSENTDKDSSTSDDAGRVEKKPKPRNPVFDAVTLHIFSTDPNRVNGKGGRIGAISSWLEGKNDGMRVIKVGFISEPATADDVAHFATWYKLKTDGKLEMPQGFPTFVEWWRKWETAGKPAAPQSVNQPRHANKPQPAAAPELSDSDRAALAAEVRAMREGLSNNG